MYTHRAKIQIKPNSFNELDRKIVNDVMPALRLQKGFCDGVTLIDTIWLTATEDTRWKTKEDAESYQRLFYPKILKMLSEVTDAESVTSIFETSRKTL